MSRGLVERGLFGLLTPLLVLSAGGLLSTLLLLTQYPASAYSVSCFLALQTWQSGFVLGVFGVVVSFVQNLPQLYTHTVTF